MGKDETAGRKKYEAPTVTGVTVTSLPPKIRGELAHLVAGTTPGTEQGNGPKDELRIVLNLEGRFQQVSEEFCSLIGHAREELLGKRIDDVTASRTVHIQQHLGAVVHFGQFHCLWMFVHRDGQGVLVRTDWGLLPDLSMEVCGESLAF